MDHLQLLIFPTNLLCLLDRWALAIPNMRLNGILTMSSDLLVTLTFVMAWERLGLHHLNRTDTNLPQVIVDLLL
jgi:hypothetical protein